MVKDQQFIQWVTFGKIGLNWKNRLDLENGLHLKEWVSLVTRKKWVTHGKMGHT